MSTQPQPPTYELQKYDWAAKTWKTAGTYDTETDHRAEGNAFYAYEQHALYGPCRLLKDGNTALGNDDPNAYYAA